MLKTHTDVLYFINRERYATGYESLERQSLIQIPWPQLEQLP